MDLDLSFENSDDTDSIQAVLPLTTRDREFFNKLNKFMDDELLKLNRKHENDASKERFAIFKLAFEKAINKTTLYRRLFRSIKHEYERCINALELGAAEVSNMRNELHRLVLEPKTYLLRQKRCMELEDKLSIIETDNKRLEDEINQINDEQVTETYRTVDTTEDVQKTGHRRVPGLTFEQETDMQALEEYYQFLKEKLHRLQQNATTKYQSRQKKIDLQDLFTRKQKELDTIREERFILRNRLRLYHIALKTIESYMENNQNGILEDAIMKALFESSSSFKTENDDDEGGEYESGAYDKEAGILLDYIENFTELIENGSYKEASYIAACSPKGVLRNMETLLRFKNIVKPDDEDITPWLFHCKVLADTALEALFKPDIVISLECAKAALDEKHVDMLYRWCAENRLTYSYELGKLIEQMAAPPTSIELAEFVYRKVNAHFEVACCLLQTGSSKRCIDYLEDVGESSNEQILKLFNLYPSVKFAVDMMNMKSNMFNAEELVLLFIQTDKHWNAIKFLQALIEQQKHIIQTETNKENHTKNEEYLVKLKKSFEMLKKWSYLADDNESKSNEIGEDKKEMESQTQTQIPLKHSLSQSSSFDDACFEDDDDNEYEFLNDEEYDSIQTTLNEKEFAHHLTRRITKSALAHFKKRVLITNATLLEAIEEHDEDATTLSTPRGSCKLQRQTDPNGVNGMKTQRTEEEAYFSENEYDEHNSNNSLQTIHNDFFNDFPGLYLTDDVLHTDSN